MRLLLNIPTELYPWCACVGMKGLRWLEGVLQVERTGAAIRETAAWQGLNRALLLELWRFRQGRSALWN